MYKKVICPTTHKPDVPVLIHFLLEKMKKWLKFNTFRMTIMDTLEMLNQLVDESDPDVDIPNMVHAFQTAERIRQVYPDDDWFHLTGLIHDMGKVSIQQQGFISKSQLPVREKYESRVADNTS